MTSQTTGQPGTSTTTATTTPTPPPPPEIKVRLGKVRNTGSIRIVLYPELGSQGDKFTSSGSSFSATLIDDSGVTHSGSLTTTELGNVVSDLNTGNDAGFDMTLTTPVPPPAGTTTTTTSTFRTLTLVGSFPAVTSTGTPKGTCYVDLTIDLTDDDA